LQVFQHDKCRSEGQYPLSPAAVEPEGFSKEMIPPGVYSAAH
jgi:hypothetical protein